MNEELKNKIFNYEVSPPQTSWSAIANELDDNIDATFPARLYSFHANPPNSVWNNISQALDENLNSSFQEKLFVFEVTPTPGL